MPSTIRYKQGDVVLVGFMFSDESGIKQRPAIVLSTDLYHQGRQEVILSAVTSNINKLQAGDYHLVHFRESGLLHPSVVTGILRTVKRSMIHRKLGKLLATDLRGIQSVLRKSLGL